MKTLTWFAAGFLCFATLVGRAAEVDVDKLKPEVETALAGFKKADSGLEAVLVSAAGHALFPKVGKGGFVIGGAGGSGLVYEKSQLIGSARVSQVTVGAQVGGQVFSQLIVFENQAALDRFKESRFEMNAQVGAIAAAEGVAKNAKYVDGVLVFTRAGEGLMAEASVGGQKFKFTPVPKK
jgi:lipid-binding SYLF domain-containing protein